MSDIRKNNRKIFANKRAFSSVVGAIFAVLVIVALTGTFFVWSLQENTRYVNSVAEMNQLVADQKKESINVTSPAAYIVAGSDVTVNVNIQNDGPISVTLKSLWLQDIDTGAFSTKELAAAPYTLAPGEPKSVAVAISLTGAVSGHQFHGWFVTARGSVVPLYPAHQTGPQGPPGLDGQNGINGIDFNATGNVKLFNGTTSYDAATALVSQGIGAISMNFKSVRVYKVDGSNTITSTSPAYTFSRTETVAFSVNVTNMDSTGPINLTSVSCMWIFSPASGAIKGETWGLAKRVGDQIITLTASEFQILQYNVSTTVYFGPYKSGGSNLGAGITGVNLVLTGTVGTYSYGQNLPFISLIAT